MNFKQLHAAIRKLSGRPITYKAHVDRIGRGNIAAGDRISQNMVTTNQCSSIIGRESLTSDIIRFTAGAVTCLELFHANWIFI